MKSCELCKFSARTYCESDQACLCWDCDAKVHGANFLVARHVRCLLCHACQSPTPWRAAGAKLGHTFSVCESCINGGGGEESEAENDDDEIHRDDGGDDEEDDGSVDDEDAEEDGENQVVPWSTTTNTPPPASSSSSSEDSGGDSRDFSESVSAVSLKRMRGNTSDLRSHQEDLDCSPSRRRSGTALATRCGEEDEAVHADAMKPLKERRIKPDYLVQADSCSRRLKLDHLSKEHRSI